MRSIRLELEKEFEETGARTAFEKFETAMWWLVADQGMEYEENEELHEILTELRTAVSKELR